MRRRRLGKNGPEVSLIGLGCMGMSGVYGPQDNEESTATIRRAMELGVTLLDTAELYGMGRNEELVGRAIKGARDRVFLATKFGFVTDKDGKFLVNGRPENVRPSCEASLRRLGVDTIDLYYQHRVDSQVPIEETVGAMARLVEEGKIRFLGLSEASPATLRRAHGVHRIAALQSEYSLWTRDVEGEILPTCRELGVGFVAYSPMGRGFLTAKLRSAENLPKDDLRKFTPRLQPGNIEKNLELLAELESIAAGKGCTPGQLALAWILAQGEDIIPIPGTRRRRHLEENVAAAEIALSPEELDRIGRAFPPGAAAGTRNPEKLTRLVDR